MFDRVYEQVDRIMKAGFITIHPIGNVLGRSKCVLGHNIQDDSNNNNDKQD